MGKSTTARDLAARYGASVLPVDAIWHALKAATDPTLYPELHYFDPPDSEWRRLGAEYWCERHIRSANAISLAMGPVIESYLSAGAARHCGGSLDHSRPRGTLVSYV